MEAILAANLPENIEDILPNDVLGKPYKCSETGALFNFQPQEIAFYKKHNIPLPTIFWKKRIRDLNKKRKLIPAV